MRHLLSFSDLLERLCAAIGRIGAWMIVPLVLIIVYDVITRKIVLIQQAVLNSPLYDFISPTKLQEAEWHLHAIIFLLAYGMAYLSGGHVRVDLWRQGRRPRTQGWIELTAILILAIPFCSVLFYHSADMVYSAWRQGEGSSALTGIPHRWIIKSFLPIGTALLICALVSTLLRIFLYLFGPAPLRKQARARLSMLTPETDEATA
ncbi:TRAP transporter small permease subunit [Roseovarius sp. ZX-A-9]|uniref:TRAP transporter small permease subunit n=1 Tax=Roseovarius sp. ZX-A-9 TaxID=3014783 RepID=UPI002331228A|nr:TRAP transporter small permease subunit [Roseovarius sp. ZX-A-9]